MSKEPSAWTICGRAIGTASGWDQADAFIIQLYDLVPHPAYTGPHADCVFFNFERGLIETHDNEGNVSASVDLIDAIRACPVDRIE